MRSKIYRHVFLTSMLLATIGCGGAELESSEAQSASGETQSATYEKSLAALALPDRFVSIRARHSWQCLDVRGSSYDPWTPFIQYPCHGGDNQQFRIEDLGNGYYRVRVKHSWQCLDVRGSSYDPWTPFIQYPCHGGDNQQFRIE
jgi:hypothetical protein